MIRPFVVKPKEHIYNHSPHKMNLEYNKTPGLKAHRIAVTVDFSSADQNALNHAFSIGGNQAHYTLIHVVETVGAMMYGEQTVDHETSVDEKLLADYDIMLTGKGYDIETKLGYGEPGKGIPKIVNAGNFDMLVMGTHGHSGFKDLILGTTVDKVRHGIKIPLMIVRD